MFKLIKYNIMRHLPIKKYKEHYGKKYRDLLCKNNNLKHNYNAFINSEITQNNNINIPKENFDKVDLNILTDGHSITIEKNPKVGKVYIEISGKNCNLKLGDLSNVIGTLAIYLRGENTHTNIGNICVGIGGMTVYNGFTINSKISKNTSVFIGDNSSFEGLILCCYHTDTLVSIGKDCMFSGGIYVMGSDTHPVYNYSTGEICNKARKGISIGDHCWVGSSVTFLKDSSVADDCIIGWGTIVTKEFNEPHCAIAGNPAKIIKRDLTWGKQDENLYLPINTN